MNQGGVGYSKLPDGTYIQYGFVTGNLTTNNFKNTTRNITFPGTAFVDTAPVCITITPTQSNFLNGSAVDSISLTGFRAILLGAPESNTAYDSGLRWIAIGRWK